MSDESGVIKLRSVINFRDIACSGYGRIDGMRKGMVFRSANPDTISRKDIARLKAAGIKTIIDLRAPAELKKRKRAINGIEIISLPMDFEQRTRATLYPLFAEKNPEKKILEFSVSLYLEILDASGPVLREVVRLLLDGNRHPILIHCQAGKDRTGIIAALLQLSIGVERSLIIESFLKSNEEIMPYYRKVLLLRKILRFGFFPTRTILFAIEVKRNNIESVLERVENHYGGINNYMLKAGIDEGQIGSLKRVLHVTHS